MKRTRIAPIVAAMKPAPWSGRYQPIVCPRNVARNEPAIPSTTVRMKPPGLFGPGESIRAMMPATNPTTTIQSKPDTVTSQEVLGDYICPDRLAVLNFRLALGAIEYRQVLELAVAIRNRDVLGAMARGFLIFVEPVDGLVGAAALVMAPGDFAARMRRDFGPHDLISGERVLVGRAEVVLASRRSLEQRRIRGEHFAFDRGGFGYSCHHCSCFHVACAAMETTGVSNLFRKARRNPCHAAGASLKGSPGRRECE